MELGETSPSKITPTQLRAAALEHLSETSLGEVFAKIQPRTDNEGNIQPQIIQNLRILLKTRAEGILEDVVVHEKYKRMHNFLEKYEEAN
ncbi:MAG: hypothetical protein WC777_03360 [Candidatus Gracilibacteria bacterium]|jgi:hypothetical protein